VETANGMTWIIDSSSKSKHCSSCIHDCTSCGTLLLDLLENKAIVGSKFVSDPRDDHPSSR